MPKQARDSAQFVQSVFAFAGGGLMDPVPVTPRLKYTVPAKVNAKLIYLRAGNSCSELIYLAITRNKKPLRLFPIGGKSAIHVTLAINEILPPETTLEILVGAPIKTSGFLVLDMGIAEDHAAGITKAAAPSS